MLTLDKDSSINAGFLYRTQPDNVKDASDESVFMLKYKKIFQYAKKRNFN